MADVSTTQVPDGATLPGEQAPDPAEGTGTRPAGGAPALWAPALVAAAGLTAVAVVACLAVLAWADDSVELAFFDPGPLVRHGLPVAKVVGDLAAALTIGVLVLTATAVPARAEAAIAAALRVASVAAGVWALATVVDGVFSYADVSGLPMSDPTFGPRLWSTYLSTSDEGRGALWTAGVALAVNLGALLARRLRGVGLLTLLATSGLVPGALAGHAASAQGSHETAVTSLGLHLLGVVVWVGGLAGLVLLRRSLGGDLARVARRYSTLALWAYVAVALSGAVNAWIHLGGLGALSSRYGVVVLAKTGALVVLGFAGWLHRSSTLRDLDAGRDGAFTRLAAVEGVVMALAVGLAVALSRSPSPVPDTGATSALSPTEAVTGYPMPPELTPSRWLTVWQPDLFWVVVCALLAGSYLVGVVRLHRRGDRWTPLRTISWFVGIAILVWVTCGAPAAYGRVLFSAHMIGHMTLSMAAPLFLVLGAPVTLLLRAVHPRADGSRGPREWAVGITESRYVKVLTHPVVVSFLFAGSLVLFYFSPLFQVALTTHVGHELMHVHFLFAGYLMAWMMIGVDPGPHRPTPPLRLVMLFITMAFHAFFGIALIQTTTVLAESYWASVGRTWGASPLEDQRAGGGIAWGIGEIPTLALAVILAVQWSMSDTREARRLDRAADRDGDAELDAYNDMLARMAASDAAVDDREKAAREQGE